MEIAVIHGPNLNLLGTREPEIYGSQTLAEVDATLAAEGSVRGCRVRCEQYNGEGPIVDAIQAAAARGAAGILINPGGYTHTSVAIRDALLSVGLPCVEVHVSNPYRRESFRHRSTIADVAFARVMGFGAQGYVLALRGLLEHLAADG